MPAYHAYPDSVPPTPTPDPRAPTLAKLSEVIGEREAGDVLDVFVAELARNAQANGSTERPFHGATVKDSRRKAL